MQTMTGFLPRRTRESLNSVSKDKCSASSLASLVRSISTVRDVVWSRCFDYHVHPGSELHVACAPYLPDMDEQQLLLHARAAAHEPGLLPVRLQRSTNPIILAGSLPDRIHSGLSRRWLSRICNGDCANMLSNVSLRGDEKGRGRVLISDAGK
jgi:hypothetical protein